jgi:hypothetical protein
MYLAIALFSVVASAPVAIWADEAIKQWRLRRANGVVLERVCSPATSVTVQTN